jgi:hypothetical protein
VPLHPLDQHFTKPTETTSARRREMTVDPESFDKIGLGREDLGGR